MATAEQNDYEIYRVIVLSRAGMEVLVVPDGDRFRLPEVAIPRWQRVAEHLAGAVKREWGQEVICLFALDSSPTEPRGGGIHYHFAEHWGTSGTSRTATHWSPVSTLSCESFTDPSDYAVLQRSIAKFRAADMGPFARPGWFQELSDWIRTVTEPLGLHLNGNFRQLNASATFSLIRFETDGPALWFKAVGDPNQREFPITQTLAKLFPNYLPPILATRTDCNGWLTSEAEGQNLSETQSPTSWGVAAAALAELQVNSIGYGDDVLAAGAHDLRAASLSELVLPFLETMASLMDQQRKIPPSVLSRTELALLGRQVREALKVVRDLGIPDTLGHLDLNPGNILVSPERCVFLDWAEAYVGHPLFSLQYLLEHLRGMNGTNSAIEPRVIEAYCAPWERVVSRAAISEALELAPLLAVFAYAAGTNAWRDSKRLEEPATAGYLRSLTRRIHREANQREQRRSVCVS